MLPSIEVLQYPRFEEPTKPKPFPPVAAADARVGSGWAAWRSFWAASRPLLVAARLLGIAPVHLPEGATGVGETAPSRVWRLYSAALVVLALLWVVHESVVGATSTWPGLPAPLVVPDVLNVAFLAATALAALAAPLANPRALPRVLNSLPEIEVELSDALKAGRPVGRGGVVAPPSRARLIAPAAATLITMLLLGVMDCFVWSPFYIGRLVVQLVICGEDALFVGLVLFLRRGLHRSNRLLEERLCQPPAATFDLAYPQITLRGLFHTTFSRVANGGGSSSIGGGGGGGGGPESQGAGRAAAAWAALRARGRLDALAEYLNAAFGVQMLLELTAVPVGAVCCVYVALDALGSHPRAATHTQPPTAASPAEGPPTAAGAGAPGLARGIVRQEALALGAAASLAWAAFRAAKLIAVCAACQAAVDEAARAALLVQRALLCSEDAASGSYEDEVLEGGVFAGGSGGGGGGGGGGGEGGGSGGGTEERAALHLLAQRLLQQPLRFSAAGFFSVDCSLIYNYAGAVATYLVVLVQFQRT